MDEQRAGTVRVEEGRKRVRAYLGGELVADTVRPLLVWERPYYPTYYFPAVDVRKDLLDDTGDTHHSPSRGDAQLLDVRGGRGVRREKAASRYDESPLPALVGTVRLDWDAMDAWFEEDEPVSVHPRNPYTRVDILNSSRRVRIEHDGLVLAESDQPRILFETGLIPRWYLPLTDARLDRLRPSETVSHCPYKGEARHWSLELEDGGVADVAWTYWSPLPESVKIRGLIAFYDEKVDVVVDGVRQERPERPYTDPRR